MSLTTTSPFEVNIRKPFSKQPALYGVKTKRLNEQVKRNEARFPADFMFQLSAEEAESLRSQFATLNVGRGGRRYSPDVFTEHGAIMAALVSILLVRLS